MGVMGGLCLLVNGILGCCAASKKIPGLIISFLVFSVLTLLPSICILLFAFVDITHNPSNPNVKPPKVIRGVSALILTFTLVDLVLCIWSIVIMAIAIHRSKINCSHCCYDSDDSAYG
jgi:hypothetical protein